MVSNRLQMGFILKNNRDFINKPWNLIIDRTPFNKIVQVNLESRMMWECIFSLFLQNSNHVLELKLQIQMCSCPLKSMYCLKKCPGAHSTLYRLYKISATVSLQQNPVSAEYARCLQQHTHTCQTNAVFQTEMQHSLFIKCNLPLEQRNVFLQE